jgi:hypothetical protein
VEERIGECSGRKRQGKERKERVGEERRGEERRGEEMKRKVGEEDVRDRSSCFSLLSQDHCPFLSYPFLFSSFCAYFATSCYYSRNCPIESSLRTHNWPWADSNAVEIRTLFHSDCDAMRCDVT